ncbi:MAG: hypothetical protein HYX68_27615 [Planctomycetes bacterium]|jgi:hypothetical protein|nr:hypothetical protein [Planctomycetota bacterium]
MRSVGGLLVLLIALPIGLTAQEKKPKPRQEYAEFSKLIHAIAVKQMPKEVEDKSGWGQRIEVPGRLPLARLRTIYKVKDRYEAPHGAWRRFKGKIEHPEKNLKIVVKDFKQVNATTYRVVVDVDATIMVAGEWQQWQKGLLLISASGVADANLTAAIVCDVGVSLNIDKFPPELKIEPKVTKLGLNFVEFKLRGGPILPGEFGDNLRKDLNDGLRQLVKAAEPMVKDEINRAIAQGLKDGKGPISAAAIMKALPAPKGKK